MKKREFILRTSWLRNKDNQKTFLQESPERIHRLVELGTGGAPKVLNRRLSLPDSETRSEEAGKFAENLPATDLCHATGGGWLLGRKHFLDVAIHRFHDGFPRIPLR